MKTLVLNSTNRTPITPSYECSTKKNTANSLGHSPLLKRGVPQTSPQCRTLHLPSAAGMPHGRWHFEENGQHLGAKSNGRCFFFSPSILQAQKVVDLAPLRGITHIRRTVKALGKMFNSIMPVLTSSSFPDKIEAHNRLTGEPFFST